MTKPKNPYQITSTHLWTAWDKGYAEGLADGLPLGEKRLARALRRWMGSKRTLWATAGFFKAEYITGWLTARLKKQFWTKEEIKSAKKRAKEIADKLGWK